MFTLEVGMFSFFVLLFVIPVVLTLLSFRNERRRSPGMESVLNEPSPRNARGCRRQETARWRRAVPNKLSERPC
jgi:hypothetical protein